MTKRIKVRGDDVKRLVDILVEEASDDAGEHRFMLDNLRDECDRLTTENRMLRAKLAAVRDHANQEPVDNG